MAWKSMGDASAAVIASAALMLVASQPAAAQDRAAPQARGAAKSVDKAGLDRLAQKAGETKAASPRRSRHNRRRPKLIRATTTRPNSRRSG